MTNLAITKNSENILGTLKSVDRSGIDFLCKFLVHSDFFYAPASMSHHLAVNGGLAEHSWNVYQAMLNISRQTFPGLSQDSISICGLLHDVCKISSYRRNTETDHYTLAEREPLGHGEKSVIVLQRYIPLTPSETLAIRWHMGAWHAEGFMQRAQLNQAVDACPLLRALILADITAAYITEAR